MNEPRNVCVLSKFFEKIRVEPWFAGIDNYDVYFDVKKYALHV